MPELTFEHYLKNLTNPLSTADVRANAAWQLGRLHDARATAPLLAAAQDPAANVRARVMEALGTRREEGVTQALLAGLDDEDDDVRAMAVRSLGAVQAAESSSALIKALGDPSPTVRAEAAQALGHVLSDDCAEPLVAAFIDDDDSVVRHFARQAITRLGGENTLAALLRALEQHRDDAAIVIDIIEVLAMLHARHTRPVIAGFSDHPDEHVRAVASWALSRL
jgi:HEAT repeat protein